MVSQQEIEQARLKYTQEQQRIEQLRQKNLPTKEQIIKGGLAGLNQRKQAAYGYTYSQRGIQQSSQQFEANVAKAAPQYAKPEYLSIEVDKVKQEIQPRIQELKDYIAKKQEMIANIKSQPGRTSDDDREDLERYQSQIKEANAKIGAYMATLTGAAPDLVSKYYSGQLQAEADYAGQQVSVSYQNKLARKEAAKKEGFDSWSDYQAYVDKANQDYRNSIQEFQKANPNEKLLFDSKGKVIGVESKYLQQSIPIGNYAGEIDRINKLQEASQVQKLPENLVKTKISGQDYYLDTKSNILYDESGKIAPIYSGTSTKQQYNQYIKDRNPVSASLEYVGEKVQGQVSKMESNDQFGQSIAGTGLVSTTVRYSPYFSLWGASIAGVAEGGGQLFTTGGRKEIQNTSLYFKEKYNVPTGVSNVGLYGLSIATMGLGSYGLYKVSSKALGYPRNLYIKPESVRNFEIIGETTGETTTATARVITKTPSYNIYQKTLWQAGMEKLGMNPKLKIIKIVPPRTDIALLRLEAQGAAARAVGVAGKATRYSTLREPFTIISAADRISLNDWNSLSAAERYAAGNLRNPSYVTEDTSMFLGESQIRKGIGISNNLKLVKISKGKKTYLIEKLPPTESQVIKTIDFVRSNQIKNPNLPDNIFMYSLETSGKQSTSLFPRASGRVDYATGKALIRLNAPEEESGINYIFNSGKVKKTPYNQKQIQGQVESFARTINKLPSPKNRPNIGISTQEKYAEYPLIVGGLGRGTSQFKGGYVEEESILRTPSSLKFDSGVKDAIKFNEKLLSGGISVLKNPSESKARELVIPNTRTRTFEVAIPREGIRQVPMLRTGLATKLRNLLIQNPRLRNPQMKYVPRPKITTPGILWGPDKSSSSTTTKLLNEDSDVQLKVRRFGRWFAVDRPTSFGKAKMKGIELIDQSLGASFRLEKAGEPISLGELPGTFRTSKKDVFTAIELPKYRLSRRSETKEINMFKRKSKSKIF